MTPTDKLDLLTRLDAWLAGGIDREFRSWRYAAVRDQPPVTCVALVRATKPEALRRGSGADFLEALSKALDGLPTGDAGSRT